MGVGLTLFCGRCCAQELAGRRTSRRKRRKGPRRPPRRIPVERAKNVPSSPTRTTRAARSRSASSPCMTSERARRSCSPGGGMTGTRCTVCVRCSRHQGCSREFLLLFFLFFFFEFITCLSSIYTPVRLLLLPTRMQTLRILPISRQRQRQHPNLNPTYDLDPPSSQQIQHLCRHMTNILHTLSLTFTACACGARAKDCALMQTAAFVDAQDEYLWTHAHALVNSHTQPNKTCERRTGGRWIWARSLSGSEDEGAYPV